MGTQTLNMAALTSASNMTYPGGMMVAGSSVTATVTGDNAYDFTYSINATIDTKEWEGSSSKLKWTLYEATSDVSGALISGCELSETGLQQNPKQYYYENCAANENITNGTEIATGQVDVGTSGSAAFDITNEQLKFENISNATGSGDGETKKFYLVVEYPNSGDQTATDTNKNATLTINSITNAVATLHQ